MGIEPTLSAWKAEVLPLSYTRLNPGFNTLKQLAVGTSEEALTIQPPIQTDPVYSLVEGEGFEPSKAEPSDLQSDPFDRSGTPPNETADYR